MKNVAFDDGGPFLIVTCGCVCGPQRIGPRLLDTKYCCAVGLRLVHAEGTETRVVVVCTAAGAGAGFAGFAITVGAGAGAGALTTLGAGAGAGVAVVVVCVGAGVRAAFTLAKEDDDRLGWKPHTC